MNVFTREQVGESNGMLTVADMLQFIKEFHVPAHAKVLVERVEDRYYEGVDITGCSGYMKDEKIGVFPQGSKASGWRVYPKEGQYGVSQYSPAFCCVRYTDEDNILFINLHY